MAERQVRVLVVDDEALIRAGLEMLCDATDGIKVVGQAANGREAVRLSGDLKPDVVLMDLRMPVMDGVTATKGITSTRDETRVLVLTTFAEENLMYDALRAGASGYLLKQAAPSQLIAAILSIHGGGAWIDPNMATKVIATLRDRAIQEETSSAVERLLTPREQQILTMVAQGMSNLEVKTALVLSEATVKTHVARILMKTGSRDRASVVALAWRSGFVQVRASHDTPCNDP